MPTTLSVVVAVHNGAHFLPHCLSAIYSSKDPETEVILVDDGSTDNSVEIGKQFGAKIISIEKCSGAAYARNTGALAAEGEIILFVDGDVIVQPGTIKHLRQIFQDQPEYSAVFGSYDSAPGEPGFFSQYRNLMHHFFHQIGCPEAETFWTGLGAVKKEAFFNTGGFNSRKYRAPSIEDIEFGYRFRENSHRILLVPELQAKHLKKWTFFSILLTDFWYRAVPWAELLLHYPNARQDLNINRSQKTSAVLVGILICLVFLIFLDWRFVFPALCSLLLIFVINKNFYAFFLQHKGLRFTFFVIPMNLLYFIYSTLAFMYSWINVRIIRRIFSVSEK